MSGAMMRLGIVGLVLEACWVAIAALTYPMTDRPGYVLAWTALLGPVTQPFVWLVPRLEALAPSTLSAPFVHGATFVGLFTGLLIASAAYVLAIVVAVRTDGDVRGFAPVVFGFSLLFLVTLWCAPVILTTDVNSYVVYGRIAAVYGANPYSVPPETFNDPLLPWIASNWWTVTTRYGPVWTDLSWAIARLTGGLPVIWQVLAYRLLGSVVFVGMVGVAWRLLGRLARATRLATFVAVAWSPLLLLQIGGNAHNDGLGVLLLLAGLGWLVRSERSASDWAWLGAITLFTLATLVKVLAAPALLIAVVAWTRLLWTHADRWRWLTGALAFLVVLTLLIDLPWLAGQLDLRQSAANVHEDYAHSLIDVPAAWFAMHVLDRGGENVDTARQIARTMFLVPAIVAFLVLLRFEIRRVWRGVRVDSSLETVRVVAGASSRTLIGFIVLVSTQVQPWYFAWPLVLGLLLGWRDMTARVAVAYGLLFTLVAYFREDTGQPPVDPLLIAYAVLPLALPLWAWARRRWLASDRLDGVRTAISADRVRV